MLSRDNTQFIPFHSQKLDKEEHGHCYTANYYGWIKKSRGMKILESYLSPRFLTKNIIIEYKN
jgi:hypothetical protein